MIAICDEMKNSPRSVMIKTRNNVLSSNKCSLVVNIKCFKKIKAKKKSMRNFNKKMYAIESFLIKKNHALFVKKKVLICNSLFIVYLNEPSGE